MSKGVMKSRWILILVLMVGVSIFVQADGNERYFSVSGGDRWAIDGDLVYIATVFGWDLADLDSAFKVSFGLRLLL